MANNEDSTVEKIWQGVEINDVQTKAIRDSLIYLNRSRESLPCEFISKKVDKVEKDVQTIKQNTKWFLGIASVCGAFLLVIWEWIMSKIK